MNTGGYQTRQGEQILSYLSSIGGRHVTAEEIIRHFDAEGLRIGRTTVYRHLEKLLQQGKLRKYNFENAQSACFQLVDCRESCDHHLHLKCQECGELFHVESDLLEKIQDTLMAIGSFEFDSMNTVFYGRCQTCAGAR